MLRHKTLLNALESMASGLAVFDADDRLLWCNRSFHQLCPLLVDKLAFGGYRAEPAFGDRVRELPAGEQQIVDWLRAGRGAIFRTHNERNGRWMEFRRHAIQDGWTLTVNDISRLRQAELALAASETSFRNVVLENQMGILIVDKRGVVLLSNLQAQLVLGKDGQALEGEYLGLPLGVDQKTEINIVRPGQRGVGVAEMSVTETIWEGAQAFLVMLQDITERKRSEEEIAHIAFHDPLTGLPNRRLLLDRLQHAAARASREDDRLAIAYLDLDGFKAVNDTLGHSGGDQLLCMAANRLRDSLRKMDTLARLGGDEFVVLMENVGSDEVVREVAGRLRASLVQPFEIAGRQIRVSTSIGISLYPEHGTDGDDLLRHADTAMYRAKQSGKNRVVFFEPGAEAEPATNRREELCQALRSGQFELRYQPQVELASGRLTGLEALLRWRSPKLGTLTPRHFLPDLEDCGLIEDVTAWTIDRACAQIVAWHGLGLTVPPVAINLSPYCLDSVLVKDTLKQSLRRSELQAGRLELEIDEAALRDDIEHVNARIGQLNSLGVSVAIDHYGVGQSSLAALWRSPAKKLKFDASMMRQTPADEHSAGVVNSLVSLGRSLNLDVVAVGVETTEQKAFLRRIGCPSMQGWLESQAVPADTIAEQVLRKQVA